jgi:hypothetical protein
MTPLLFNWSLPITDYRLPITDYRLPITDYRLPITDYRLLITHYRLPITDYPLPITHYRLPITDYPLRRFRNLGLINSLNPSPTSDSPTTINVMASPGKRAVHQIPVGRASSA